MCAAILCAGVATAAALAQRSDAFGESITHPAIAYSTAPVDDPVSKLDAALEAGGQRLAFEPKNGYLRSVLEALDVPVESQVLVFSQTSSQAPLIAEKTPRAIYFNDRVAVGWVPGGEILELASQDSRQGSVFYALPQTKTDKPRFERDDTCLRCHLSWDTRAVPGPFVMSTHPRKSEGEYANGGVVDDREPISHRWGGWYVTGQAVPRRHMGNRAMLRPDAADPEHTPPPPAWRSLEGQIDTRPYPTPYSDVVALLVLEHQAHVMNLLTWAGWEQRVASYGMKSIAPSRASGLAPRAATAVDELVDYMLFVDEAPLPGRVAGSSGFAEWFAAQGPRDPKGRSLRDLDLNGRLMRYPLSYMIYSPAFDGLPDEVKQAFYARLWRVLSGDDAAPRYAHVTRPIRQAIVEILRATVPDLPAMFQPVTR